MPEEIPVSTVPGLSSSGSLERPGYITVRDTVRPVIPIIPTITIIPIRTGISPQAITAAVGETIIIITTPDPPRVPAITAAVHSVEEVHTEEASAAAHALQVPAKDIRDIRTVPVPAVNPHSEALIRVPRAHIPRDRTPRVHIPQVRALQVPILRARILQEEAAAPVEAALEGINKNQYIC